MIDGSEQADNGARAASQGGAVPSQVPRPGQSTPIAPISLTGTVGVVAPVVLGITFGSMLLLTLGNASSASVFTPALLPEWLAPFAYILPPGAGVRALAGASYFGWGGVPLGVAVLVAWVVLSGPDHLRPRLAYGQEDRPSPTAVTARRTPHRKKTS